MKIITFVLSAIIVAGCEAKPPMPVVPLAEKQVVRIVCETDSLVSFQAHDKRDGYGLPVFSEGPLRNIDRHNPEYYGLLGGFRITGDCWVNVWDADAWER